jgi:hypothetical protein
VLLLLPNLVPHPVSFHINVLVCSKNEIAVILLFAAITIYSIILESIKHINNVKCYSYRCCLILSVQMTWGGCIFIVTARYPATSRTTHEENILSLLTRRSNFCQVTIVKSEFVREC